QCNAGAARGGAGGGSVFGKRRECGGDDSGGGAGVRAEGEDGDRGISGRLLWKSIQRELEPSSDAARCASGKRGVVRDERPRQQPGEEHLPDQLGGPRATDAFGRPVLDPSGRVSV